MEKTIARKSALHCAMVSLEMHTLSQERAPVEERVTWLSELNSVKHE